MASKSIYWEDDEIRKLEEAYRKKIPIKEICKILGRSKNSVSQKAKRIKLDGLVSWSKDEEDFIRNNYIKKSSKEIAKDMNRSHWAINSRLSKLGLKRNNESLKNIMKSRDKTNFKRGEGHYKWKGGDIDVLCSYCRKKIKKPSYVVKIRTNLFCNKQCSGKYSSKYIRKENHPNWKGGVRKTSCGYIIISCQEHPNKDSQGYIREHRLVVEKFIGRYLTKKEVVHHIDFNKQNNSINNLMIFKSTSEHISFHIYFNKYGWNKRVRRMIAERWKNYKNIKN